MDEMVDRAMPTNIRLQNDLSLDPAMGEWLFQM